MPKSYGLKPFLDRAKEQEKKYNWPAATESYKKALGLVLKSRDFPEAGEIQERIGYCLYRAALQAETNEDFRKCMRLAVEAYERAAELFTNIGKELSAKIHNFKAMVAYINFWLAPETPEKRKFLDECWDLGKMALKTYEEAGDRLGYAKACNEILECLYHSSMLEWNWQELKRITEQAVHYGESAITSLSEMQDEHELARAYYLTSLQYVYLVFYEQKERKKKGFGQKALRYSQRALELSKKLKDDYLIANSSNSAGYAQFIVNDDLELALKHYEEMLEEGTKTRDNRLIGGASISICRLTILKMEVEEKPDKKREELERAMGLAENAISRSHLLSFDFRIAHTYSIQCEICSMLARDVETHPEEKRILLERAIQIGRKGLEFAERLGYLSAIMSILAILSRAHRLLSPIETNLKEKTRLLEEALLYQEKSIAIMEKMLPFNYIDRALGQNHLALIRSKLARIARDKKEKRSLLDEAVSNMEECLALCKRWTKIFRREPKALSADLGKFHDDFGTILNQLYTMTGEEKVLVKVVEAYEGSIEAYAKADLPSRVAEALWQMAKARDRLGEYLEAAENFESASSTYRVSAEKIPQLNDFYLDYASYMDAWSEVERAKHDYEREKYGQSKEHYEKAINIFQSSKSWAHLAPYFSAWSLLDHAEDLSRTDSNQESMQFFEKAAELFSEAKRSLEVAIDKIESLEEKEKANELIRASDTRRKYSLGRITIEEAVVLDKKGDDVLSARKYASAADAFERMAETLETDAERRELQSIVWLCRAWQKMKQAEWEASPELYLDASNLFLKAREAGNKAERSRLLALGNSAFCRALEAGTRFEATGDTAFYSTAKRFMDVAASYYMKARFESASTWTNATQALFDAYVYMDKAETEVDAEEKLRLYLLAERFLDRSADLFDKAGYLGKRDEVLRSLGKVKEKREFMLSLRDILLVPSIASSTTCMSAPTLTHEEAVGLERFAHADIQAKLIPRLQEVKIGDDISLEIELVNAGKGPALLIKVEEIIPESFKLIEKPDIYRVEDRYLNMKGKRLPPLKTEEVKLVLKPLEKGTFHLKPRVLYLDETGKYKSHEPEPITVTVKELGISGWLKGPSR